MMIVDKAAVSRITLKTSYTKGEINEMRERLAGLFLPEQKTGFAAPTDGLSSIRLCT